MANNTLSNVRIAHKNDTKANWTSKNPVLLKGEIGIEFDPSATDSSYIVKFKIGDGTNHWADLDYFGGEVTLPTPDGTSIVADNNVWSIAGFAGSTANKFPVKRITSGVSSIEWVELPANFSDFENMRTKLAGIQKGAQVNTVNSVNEQTGNVSLTASDVGAEPAFTKNTAFNKNFETLTTNIKMNGTVSVGTSSNVARADHVHPTDTTRASAEEFSAHTSASNPHNITTTKIGAEPAFTKNTAFNKNFETDATKLKANGTANVGTLTTVARADHVHPTDTTRAAAADLTAHTSASNPHNITTEKIKAVSYDTTIEVQSLSDSQKARARLNIGAEPAFTKNTAFNKNFETDATKLKANGTANVGTSANVARADHVHPTDTTRAAAADLTAHTSASNPHGITKTTIGLGNVGNFKAVSTVANQGLSDTEQSNAITNIGAIPASEKGAANGVATLDNTGLIPTSQLPSFVDDVLEGTAQGVTETSTGTKTATGFILKGETKTCTPEEGKIYIDSVGTGASNIVYRWTGTLFASIGVNLVLGETAETAYRGDHGLIAYNHSQTTHAPSNAEANVINAITVGGTAATVTSKTAAIPIASTSNPGVVKSSTSNNNVSVNSSSGVMTVNNITTDKLVAGSNTLVLDCGNATI